MPTCPLGSACAPHIAAPTLQAMRGAAEQMAVVQHPAGSPNKRRRGGPQRTAAWEPWQHNAQVVARAGRMARELHEQAVQSCQVGWGWPAVP